MERSPIEDRLNLWGGGLLVLSIAAGFGCALAAGYVLNPYKFQAWGSGGVSWSWLLVGAACVLQGILTYTLLSALAEVIRLLRRLNKE